MIDRLVPYYDRELDALRNLGDAFATAHPAAAGGLRLSRDVTDDPHVERLLEATAFLTARVQQRLDDEYPEFSDALLDLLYPHYLAPVPSSSIVRFASRPELRVPLVVAAGTELVTDLIGSESCRFRTTQDVQLWPIEVEAVRLSGLPLPAPNNPQASRARSVLRISLRLADPAARFFEFDLARLRFFLQGPAGQGSRLYEMLCGHVLGIALADGPNDDRPTLLPPSAITPVGFAPDEALYPWIARAFTGFRLLTEYFALPEKFLFVDIGGLDARMLVQESDHLDIFVYFDCSLPDLERLVDTQSMAIGCTPVVNLFRRACEPIRLDGRSTEYLVMPEARRPEAFEVWSVDGVREIADDGSARSWAPFYHHRLRNDPVGTYLTARRDSVGPHGGTDLFLLPVEKVPSAKGSTDAVLSVDALCTNRDLPAKLPFGGGQPALHLAEGIGSIASITCLMPFVMTGRPSLREGRSRQLISQLALGHLSLVDGGDAASALREILALYDFRRTGATWAAIEGLVDVRARDATARVPGARTGSFVRGLDVELRFDPASWETAGLFVLATVLDRFLALHATINAFVRTRASLVGRPDPVARFSARAGMRPLL